MCDAHHGCKAGRVSTGLAQRLAYGLIVGVAMFICACGGNRRRAMVVLADDDVDSQSDLRATLTQQLFADIYDIYNRDEPPEIGNTILGVVGSARIGVGPGDVLVGQELRDSPSRWPLVADPPGTAKSKLLRVQLSADLSTAWVSDEISWRATVCNRSAVVPMRLTAMFARDGDRWVNVFEHLSYGHDVIAAKGNEMIGKTVSPMVVSRDTSDALSRVLAPVLAGQWSENFATTENSVAIGPRWSDEWRSNRIGSAPLSPVAMVPENRRVGVIGRDVEKSTTAYWVGTFLSNIDGKRVRLRGTFVFENRNSQWQLMQSHVSVPVDDDELAARIFGTGIEGLNPLKINCQ